MDRKLEEELAIEDIGRRDDDWRMGEKWAGRVERTYNAFQPGRRVDRVND